MTGVMFALGFTVGVALVAALAWLVVRYLVAHHSAEVARVTATYDSAIRMMTTGSPTAIPARIEEREPDAQDRLSRTVAEETIKVGMDRLRAGYKELGLEIDDETLRAEAEQILLAGSVTTPMDGMVKARGA